MSRFARAARRRRCPGGDAIPSFEIEGMVVVDEEDLGPGVFGVGQFAHGVFLTFTAAGDDDARQVAIALTAESAIELGEQLVRESITYLSEAQRTASMN